MAGAAARAVAWLVALLAAVMGAAGCADDAPPPPGPLVRLPAGFPPLPEPAENPLTAAKVTLGRRLFQDKRLSRTGEIACASCHQQSHAFADARAFSLGVDGRTGVRNAPALINLAWAKSLFWDGGVPTLERQVIAPIMNALEMDDTIDAAVSRVAADAEYQALFQAAFAAPPTPLSLTEAIASFERTLVSGDSAADRFDRGDGDALSAAARRGRAIFFGEKGECFHCHTGFNFTDERFANNGTYLPGGDVGRQRVTLRAVDLGRFKVPTLRNVAVTAPYMHDGSIATLEEVVDHYARGGRGDESTDPSIRALALSATDRADLVAFLRALTDEAFLR